MASVEFRKLFLSSLNKKRYFCKTTRLFSTTQANSKNSNENINSKDISKSPEQARKEAAQLAIQSLKDFGSMLSSSSSDDATQPIDTRPIFNDPKFFGSLSLLHQGQVLKELQDKYDKKWHKLTKEDKKLGYYIAYGDWGVRENFKNWKTNEPPYDLPFRVPSILKAAKPTKGTIIRKLDPPVILAETPIRAKQFDYKRMDGVSKFFIYLTLFISMFAIYRDKTIGEAGKPAEVIIEDPYEKNRQMKLQLENQELERQKEAFESHNKRKWYYLWLK